MLLLHPRPSLRPSFEVTAPPASSINPARRDLMRASLKGCRSGDVDQCFVDDIYGETNSTQRWRFLFWSLETGFPSSPNVILYRICH
mmetsp:Transcript_114693/g.199475  ORF Transcript_114693/g.199475 Transcript_114693/m.199475 type:complete len:87 (+) Transcript_114693:1881-2141(+)